MKNLTQLSLLVLLAACGGGEKRTLLFLQLEAGPSAPQSVQSVHVGFTLGDRNAEVTLAERDGTPLSFPTGDVIEIASGSGQIDVLAVARDANDMELARALGSVQIASGESKGLVLTFGGDVPDGSTDDMAESPDLLDPGDGGPTATVPDAPTNVVATAGLLSASVSWTIPASDGGSPIIAYVITSDPDAVQAITTAPSTSAQVNGLRAGVAYTFTVRAANAVGLGPESAPSNSVTPTMNPTAPGAPTMIVATATNGANASLTWLAPSANGSAITNYEITTTPATTMTTLGNVTSANLTGFTPGTSITFSVRARNALGLGPPGTSNAIVPGSLPGAPTIGTATALAGFLGRVTFTAAPTAVPGVTLYRVTGVASGQPNVTAQANATTIDVAGLVAGESYTFTVRAVNGIGEGPASAATNAIIGGSVPVAPTGVTATQTGPGTANVTWVAPANVNGYALTGYIVRSTSGVASINVGAGATSATLSQNLLAGQAHVIQVIAQNALGSSAAGQVGLNIPCSFRAVSIGAIGANNFQYGSGGVPSQAPWVLRSGASDVTGWIQYSMAGIPNWAGFQSITLRANVAPNVLGTVVVQTSAANDLTAPPRSATVSGSFSLTGTGVYSFPISLTARAWASDNTAADEILILGVTGTTSVDAALTSPTLDLSFCE